MNSAAFVLTREFKKPRPFPNLKLERFMRHTSLFSPSLPGASFTTNANSESILTCTEE
jgi:hypothetical protein